MIKRKKLWVLFGFSLILIIYLLKINNSQNATYDNVPVEVTRVKKQDIDHILEFSGKTLAFQTGLVLSQVSGQIIKDHFVEGTMVKEGQLLLEVDPRMYQYTINQAQASLDKNNAQLVYAQREFERYSKLDKDRFVSQDKFEETKMNRDSLLASIEADKANISSAKLMLEYCNITAPVSGIIGELEVTIGNFIKANESPLATITRITPIYISFDVDEDTFEKVRTSKEPLNTPVLIKTKNGLEIKESRLSFIDNTINPVTGSINMKAIYDNKELYLWSGQHVKVYLSVEKIINAKVIPTKALQINQTGQYVFVVNDKNQAQMKQIEVKFTQGDLAVISSGLEEGEIVVTDGQIKLINNKHVKITGEK
jgi:multidrug efflux system membrane fusion protein